MAAVAEDRAERLAEPAATVSPEVTCGEIYERFQQDPDLFSVPVVRDGLPLGMVHRQDLVLRLADRFGRALYERKPVEHLMDAAPLIVDAEMGFDALSRLILSERPSALTTGFIVTKDGRYLGCGTAMSMLRLRVALSERAARELEQARWDAEAANRAKSNFLANMCHELRTPLNAIIGFSDMMQREVFGRLGSERYLEYAQDINDSGGHLLNVINEILDLSKVEAGRMEIAIERLEIEGLVRTALRMVETQAARCAPAAAGSPISA
jgi:two-component system cell cycle sensor histidine kinase PleC